MVVFARLYGQYEICDDVGDGPRESTWPAEKAVCEFFDSDEKTGNEREAMAINSGVSHIPFVQAYTLVCCDAPHRVKNCLSCHELICLPVIAEVFRLQSNLIGSPAAT